LFAQKDLLNHQLEELIQYQFNQDELDSIENNYKISSNASLLIEKISKILKSLDDESGVNNILIEAEDVIGQAQEFDDRLETIRTLLSNSQVQVQESIYDLTNYLSKVSSQESNVNDLEARINMLHDLGRKHRCQIPELLDAQNSIQNKLNEFDTSSDQLEELLKKQKQLEKDYFKKSKRLSEKRQHASVTLSEKVTDLMQDLGMPGSEILFCLNSYKDSIRSNGNEEIIIHVKTNVGQDLKPLSKVASGGELSRISLALSVVTSKTELTPSIVFDEVDVGISGSVAEIVGLLLKKLSDRYQIICVTHLAQVAAQGKEHLKVIKTQQSGSTFTQVTALNQEQRTNEVARILGGIKISEKTRIAAEEMIKASA
jgi:DNA repair protein RecN (Recombination protein N)